MTYLSADASSTVTTGMNATSSNVSDVAQLISTVQYWKTELANAKDVNARAHANLKLAESEQLLAEARRVESQKNMKWYILAGCGGVGVLMIAAYLASKRKS